jgi:hypothetical protein
VIIGQLQNEEVLENFAIALGDGFHLIIHLGLNGAKSAAASTAVS